MSSRKAPVTKLTGVCIDSRTIRKGELFIAVPGDRFDGHNFALSALQKGAAAAVVSEAWFKQNRNKSSLPFITVPDTLAALQEYARFYRLKFRLPVVAITGSSGKTTTKEYLAAVLGQKFNVLKSEKSFNNHIGVPLTLFRLRQEHNVLVCELGTSNFGELERLSFLVQPTVCVLTNIGHAHLQFLQNLDGVARAKAEIFIHADKNGTAVLNADDSIMQKIKVPMRHRILYGIRNGDFRAENLSCNNHAQYSFTLFGQEISLKMAGRHNVFNALAAASAGKLFEIKPAFVKKGLESVKDVEKRMQVFYVSQITVISDVYNSNIDSCRAAVQTMADMFSAGGRRILVLADNLELGAQSAALHGELGLIAAEYKIETLFLHGKETRFTAESAMGKVADVVHFEKKQDLISALKNYVTANDIVLVKGSRAMHMETVIEELLKFLTDKEA
ncbi:UDP-N-acetylmuramoyl-tripeptide--D-alanyl-D-alanine ligase [candidate division KSB1 bacterium]|nr:UDP-N-acetylmuramoyl-tripeptide--D-alanyl-D-alanine ligase [candidate division KSB1 bacterium]